MFEEFIIIKVLLLNIVGSQHRFTELEWNSLLGETEG